MNNDIKNNIVTSPEIHHIIKTSVQSLLDHPEHALDYGAILLRGAPGVGKSTIIKNISKELGIGFIDVRLAQMERVDLCGLPSVKDGVTEWNVPAFWPRDPQSKGILFFDEITAAPSDCQVAAYSLILDRKIPNSDYKLPDGWFIVAAGNRAKDRAVAKSMSSALANRFCHFELEAKSEDWGEWALQNDIHPSVTGYINYRPANLFSMDAEQQNLEQGWPSPRSWERVSNMIPLFNDNEDALRKVVYGLIGPSVGVEFIEFHRINKRFDDVLKLMTDPKAEVKIPAKNDEKYALCSAVAYLLWNGKNEEDEKLRINGLYKVAMALTPDFAVMLMKNCMVGNSKVSRVQAAMKICSDKENYAKFAKKFGTSFAKKYTLD